MGFLDVLTVVLRLLPSLSVDVAEHTEVETIEPTLFGGVCGLAACTSATMSDLATLRGPFNEDGEGSVLGPAPAHCVRADGGPGSLETLLWERANGGATPLLVPLDETVCEPTRCFGRTIAPKSLIVLLSALPTSTASSICRFPREDEARLVSGLSCTCLRLGKVEVDAPSAEVELGRPLELSDGMLLLVTPRIDRATLLSCEVELSCNGSLCATMPTSLDVADFEASLAPLCCARAARNENLGEESPPMPPNLCECCCCCCALRSGEGKRD